MKIRAAAISQHKTKWSESIFLIDAPFFLLINKVVLITQNAPPVFCPLQLEGCQILWVYFGIYIWGVSASG